MTKISKGDFIEIEYTGRVKENGIIFDTTDGKLAKENELHGHDFGPVVICVGEGHVLPGIDKNLEGKEAGKNYELSVNPEDAFGSKSAKLIQLIPTNKFKRQNIQPMPGMQLNIDGMMGIVKTVSGGRTLVDFNHPFSGKELFYKVNINKKVTDDGEKLQNLVKLSLGIKDFETDIKEGNATISLKAALPKQAAEEIGSKITELIPGIKKAEFVARKEQKQHKQ